MFSRRSFVTTSLLFAASGALPAAISAADSLDAATEKEIDTIAAKAMQVATRERTPGLAVAISRDGKVVFARGYGMANLETATQVQPDTVFRIGSITKEFTAASILQLVESDKLSLDEPLSNYFSQIRDGDEVTIRQLLNHTSGIHSYTGGTAASDLCVERSTEEMVALIAAQDPLYDHPPGSLWRYSNSGYYLLGAVVEKISGLSLRDYFEQKLFKPLGMKSTALDQTRELVPNRATGYSVASGSALGFERADFYPMTRPGGAGAVRSTVLELIVWHDALFSGRVVSRKSFDAMIEPGRVNDGRLSGQAWFNPALSAQMPDLQYGLGLMHGKDAGHSWIGHSGGINGYSAWVKTYPAQGLTIAILSNAGGASAVEKEIAPAVLESLDSRG